VVCSARHILLSLHEARLGTRASCSGGWNSLSTSSHKGADRLDSMRARLLRQHRAPRPSQDKNVCTPMMVRPVAPHTRYQTGAASNPSKLPMPIAVAPQPRHVAIGTAAPDPYPGIHKTSRLPSTTSWSAALRDTSSSALLSLTYMSHIVSKDLTIPKVSSPLGPARSALLATPPVALPTRPSVAPTASSSCFFASALMSAFENCAAC
jgi:hypothetical protein